MKNHLLMILHIFMEILLSNFPVGFNNSALLSTHAFVNNFKLLCMLPIYGN